MLVYISDVLDSHKTKSLIYVFPETKLCGLIPDSYIHVAVSDLYIPRIGLPTYLAAAK